MQKTVVAFLLALVPFSTTLGEHWPGWLGPDRNGWVENFTPPATWPQELEKQWQVDVGTGYATPLVHDDRVYSFSRQGEKEILMCLELTTGKEVWKKEYEVPFKMGGGGEWHGKGPKSNPYLMDGRIFTLSISGILSAWSAKDGEFLWRRDYSDRYRDLEKATPYWGACTSPIVDEDRVIVHFGGDKKGELVALNVETGEEVWRQGQEGAAYASPFVAEIYGVKQIVEWNHSTLAGIESKTGKLLWEFPFAHVGTNQNMPSPILYDGTIIVGGENRGIRRVAPKLENGQWSAEEVWHQKKVALDMSTAILNGDKLFGFSHYKKGQLFCLAAETGEVLWEGPGRTGNNVTFLSLPGHVAALLDNGELQFVKATDKDFEKVASYQVSDKPTWAAPVLLSQGILIKDRESLLYLKLPKTNASN